MDDAQESGRARRRSRFGRSSSADGSISCQRYDVGRARATKRSRHGASSPCIDAIAASRTATITRVPGPGGIVNRGSVLA
jgi:hypothetical protein